MVQTASTVPNCRHLKASVLRQRNTLRARSTTFLSGRTKHRESAWLQRVKEPKRRRHVVCEQSLLCCSDSEATQCNGGDIVMLSQRVTSHRDAAQKQDDRDDSRTGSLGAEGHAGAENAQMVPARILFAEDDKELRTLVAMRLRTAGFDITEAASGGELMDFLVDTVQPDGSIALFDMVLSDINMPDFSALDVMTCVPCCLRDTPIVLITAFGDTATHERALRLGATAVLDKPFRLDALTGTICDILAKMPARPPAAPFTETAI